MTPSEYFAGGAPRRPAADVRSNGLIQFIKLPNIEEDKKSISIGTTVSYARNKLFRILERHLQYIGK